MHEKNFTIKPKRYRAVSHPLQGRGRPDMRLLSPKEVSRLRGLYGTTMSPSDRERYPKREKWTFAALAMEFEISPVAAFKIVHHHTYKNIT